MISLSLHPPRDIDRFVSFRFSSVRRVERCAWKCTSNHSMVICHRMLEMFIEEIFRQELVEKDPQEQQILLMQQTRTIDRSG